ncbi:MAG: type II secretion system protein GspL [Reinekea sp.]|jgi:type II secretion system protein L|nr:type II secretion system protein GspL [Reinekea sp.]
MSTQLSLYWQAPDKLQWYWSGEADVYTGSLEELQDQKKLKNLETCLVRLFLPASWFSSIELMLPVKSRRLSPAALKFAAEEFLAQDIDTVHLVEKGRTNNGKTTVEVTEIDRLRFILQTLSGLGFVVNEAFNTQWFSLPEDQTDDVVIQVQQESIVLSANNQVFNLHTKGFAQWFELWAKQNDIAENATIKLISDSAEGPSKVLATEFEASGFEVNWVVQNAKKLIDWHEEAERKKIPGNLITGIFSQRSGNKYVEYWMPALVASVAALVLWSTLNMFQNHRLTEKIEQTWEASEKVFLQVFGNNKRIQRPLMVREMRTLASNSDAANSDQKVNALQFLSDISAASSTFVLEDFRFSRDRGEATFTLVQPVDVSGDAYNLFEALKNDMSAKNYSVEYSANQDKDAFRARFKATYGGQG